MKKGLLTTRSMLSACVKVYEKRFQPTALPVAGLYRRLAD